MYDQNLNGLVLPLGSHAAIDLTSAAVQSFSWQLLQNCRVWRLGIKVTTATVSNVTIVVTFRRRPTNASASGQSSLGTISIPTAIAANKVYYKDITPVNCVAGDQIVAEVTTAAGGGGAAGQGVAFFYGEPTPETAANESNFVASA